MFHCQRSSGEAQKSAGLQSPFNCGSDAVDGPSADRVTVGDIAAREGVAAVPAPTSPEVPGASRARSGRINARCSIGLPPASFSAARMTSCATADSSPTVAPGPAARRSAASRRQAAPSAAATFAQMSP